MLNRRMSHMREHEGSKQKGMHSNSFYQGNLDSFCAVYAVLNALGITHGLTLSNAVPLFREILLHMSADTQRWYDTVHNATDFLWLVEDALEIARFRGYLLDVERPWAGKSARGPCTEKLCWREMRLWLSPVGAHANTVIFRFHRFLPGHETPVISHWTVGETIENDTLILCDSSHEPRATRTIHSREFRVRREKIDEKSPILIDPDTLFFIRPS